VIKPFGTNTDDRRYDDYPRARSRSYQLFTVYEALLARAYNLRLLQSLEHSSTPINFLYGYPDVPCCNHYFRSDYYK
jgi:hypothetical protein